MIESVSPVSAQSVNLVLSQHIIIMFGQTQVALPDSPNPSAPRSNILSAKRAIALGAIGACSLLAFGLHTEPARQSALQIVREKLPAVEYIPLLRDPAYSNQVTFQIPSRIWQLGLYDNPPDETTIDRMNSWLYVNPKANYNRLSHDGALRFVLDNFQHRPDLIELYTSIKAPVLAADLLRYMLLAVEGGVYADLDVTAKQPIEKWAPARFRRSTRVIVGFEYDRVDSPYRNDGNLFDVQFSMWTIAASPNHPLLWHAVDAAADAIHELAIQQGVGIAEVHPNVAEVYATTGPVQWSKLIYQALSERAGHQVTASDLSGLLEPTLFGDILVLPIDYLAGNVGDSNAGRFADRMLVEHHFAGSCRLFSLTAHLCH